MNFDDITNTWNNMEELSDKPILTDREIQSVIKKKGRRSLIKSLIPELVILTSNLYIILMLLVFQDKFDNQLLKSLSFLSIFILLCQSGIIYSTIRIINNKMKLSTSYHQTILQAKNECRELNQRYYIILGMGLIILLLCVILLPKIYSEDLSKQQILYSYAVCLLFLGYLSYRIYRYYKQLIWNNNNLKNDLFQD